MPVPEISRDFLLLVLQGQPVSLNELMDEMGADAFASTQRNAASGDGNTDPRHAYRQAAHLELSSEGLAWLRDRGQTAFDAHGSLPQDWLETLA